MTPKTAAASPFRSEFVVRLHHAERAGTHHDLHLDGESYAVPKGVPREPGIRVLAIRTTYHTPEEARFSGEIKSGYGKGTSEVLDEGEMEMISSDPEHRFFQLRGNIFTGNYYLRHWQDKRWLLWKR